MSGPVVAIFAVAYAVMAAGSVRFQQGRTVVFLRWYRSPDLPAAVRNAPLVLPAVLVLAAPLVALMIVSVIGPALRVGASDRVVGTTFLAGFANLFLLVGFIATCTFRPPRRFTPAWLVDDDRRVGYMPPGPGWFDRLVVIVLGVPFLVLGVVALLAAVVYAIAGA